MKRFVLVIFILVDVLVMGAAAIFLYWHLTNSANVGAPIRTANPVARPVPPAPIPHTSVISTTTAITPNAPAVPIGAPTPPAPGVTQARPATPSNPSGTRNIGFSYRNSRAHQVAIRADFNGWKAEPMQKDPRGVWTYQAVLPPGEYAYCFTVDDKIVRDPANKRTKQIGQTFVSSIVVLPLGSSGR